MTAADPATEARNRAVEICDGASWFSFNGAVIAQASDYKARYLYRAVEMAVRAVLTAWGRPTAGPKIWSSLSDRLAPSLHPDVLRWVDLVRRVDPALVDQLLAPPGRDHFESILSLISSDPPPGWEPRPLPLDWQHLPVKDRAFLVDAAARAAGVVSGAELWLFGSRATGEARDDSDYDIRIVLPEDTPDAARGLVMGEVWQAGQDHGVTTDRDTISRSEFDSPSTQGDVLLIYEVRTFGLRVPVDGAV